MRITTAALTAASLDDRTLTYRLLPYGEPGATSLGRVTVSAGRVSYADAIGHILNVEHDRTRPVARCTDITERTDGLHASYFVPPTPAGDALLAEAAAGLRTGISVELDPVDLDRGGALLAGVLVGAAAVAAPAYPSAVLTASETEQLDDDDDTENESDTDPDPDPDPATLDPNGDDADNPEDDTVTETAPVTEPATLTPPVVPSHTPDPALTAADVSQRVVDAFRAARKGGSQAELMAALVNITQTTSADTREPSWLGEVWRAQPEPRPFIDSVSKGTLTADGMRGWAFTDPPSMATYAGDKTDVPSDTVTFGPVSAPMARLAVAHDIDRVVFDFNETEVLEGYWAQVAKSYSVQSEARCAAGIIAAATAGAATPLATTPSAMIVAAIQAIAAAGGHATFIGLGSTLIAELALTPANNLPALLGLTVDGGVGSGGASGIRWFGSVNLAPTQIVAGDREAFIYAELSGTPIRVEAQHIAQGGVDVAGFGYTSVLATKPSALYKVTRAATAR